MREDRFHTYQYGFLFLLIMTFWSSVPLHLLLGETNNTAVAVTAGSVSAMQAQATHPPIAPDRQYWGTFYYPWYGGAGQRWRGWNDLSHKPPATWASMYLPDDGSGAYTPSLELYSSSSTQEMSRHLGWMDRARLDFALVSWWGKGSYEDLAFAKLLTLAAQNSSVHVKLGIYYELICCPAPSVSQVVSNLTYIYDSYAQSPAYFKVTNGSLAVPVVFVYAGPSAAVNYTSTWSQARELMYSAGKPLFISLKVWTTGSDNWRNYANMVDSWHQYAPATRYQLQNGYSAFASPGYFEYPELASQRGHSYGPMLPRNSTDFAAAVSKLAMLAPSQAQFLLIETFNEWHEGTQIEPGMLINHNESGFSQAAPSYSYTFIDIVAGRGTPPGSTGALSTPPLIYPLGLLMSIVLEKLLYAVSVRKRVHRFPSSPT